MRIDILSTALFLAPLLLAGTATAQSTYELDIDSQASSFVWTGNSSIGPINGVPNNNFSLGGYVNAVLGSGAPAQAISSLRLAGGTLVTPDIRGEIPNILPFLPPLAEIEIVSLRLEATSQTRTVAANGDFSTFTTLTVVFGWLILTPAGSSPTFLDLAGKQSDPTLVSGSVTSGSSIDLAIPVSFLLSIFDPGTGISIDLTLDGSIVADRGCGGQSYCTTSPNSAGAGALLLISGSGSLFANDMAATVVGLPGSQPGLLYFGTQAAAAPFGDGTRCAGGTLVRLPPAFPTSGFLTIPLDVQALGIPAGTSRYFQFWYRDPAAGNSGFNLSDAFEMNLCP